MNIFRSDLSASLLDLHTAGVKEIDTDSTDRLPAAWTGLISARLRRTLCHSLQAQAPESKVRVRSSVSTSPLLKAIRAPCLREPRLFPEPVAEPGASGFCWLRIDIDQAGPTLTCDCKRVANDQTRPGLEPEQAAPYFHERSDGSTRRCHGSADDVQHAFTQGPTMPTARTLQTPHFALESTRSDLRAHAASI